MTGARSTDLAVLAGLLERPLRVEEAAAALELSPQEVMSHAREAVDSGLLIAEGAGYAAVGGDLDVDPPYIAYLAGRLAEALRDRGANAEAGTLFARAGRHEDAIVALVEAALVDDDDRSANLALELDPDLLLVDRADAGRLHLMMSRHARNHGDSPAADAHSRDAVRRLEGGELIDALGRMGI